MLNVFSLSLLDLSSSRLNYLSNSLLVSTPSLKVKPCLRPVLLNFSPPSQKLMLQNNSLSSLPSDLLSPLDGLLLLNLSTNLLTDSDLRPILRDQVKLIALDLSHNRLAKVGNSPIQIQILDNFFLNFRLGEGSSPTWASFRSSTLATTRSTKLRWENFNLDENLVSSIRSPSHVSV